MSMVRVCRPGRDEDGKIEAGCESTDTLGKEGCGWCWCCCVVAKNGEECCCAVAICAKKEGGCRLRCSAAWSCCARKGSVNAYVVGELPKVGEAEWWLEVG